MADLTLRGQLEQASNLIGDDRAEEAVVVCRRVLETFPKHVGTYRVLAGAYLAMGKRREAINLLNRVLSADPENVASYISLAAIYEEQGLLDEALWHLQRAFDLCPGDVEIRQELRRMYRDRGLPDAERVKLTRAALARVYVRGQLYAKAIDELRDLLASEGDRFDLHVALVETLWLSRLYELADTACQALLSQLPNCLKANLILGQIWFNTSKDGEARALFQRAQALDPENTAAQAILGERSPLPPRIARLPFRDDDAPALNLPYLEMEEEPVSDPGTATDEWHNPLPTTRVLDQEPRDIEPAKRPADQIPPEAEPALRKPTPADTPSTAQDAPLTEDSPETERRPQAHSGVGELATRINWDGMSVLDVRRQYVADHPEDHEARLDLARRYRDALKLDESLKHYARLVEKEEIETLGEVIHDLELLGRIHRRNAYLEQLLAIARKKGRQEPPGQQ